MEPIRGNNYIAVRVRKDFCHPSYWENDKKQYGELEDNGEYGHLFIHKKEDETDSYGNAFGEGYLYCGGCDTIFNSDEESMEVYEKSDEILCAHCARDYVKENIKEFLNEGLPNFNRPLPSVNLEALQLDDIPGLTHAPEDVQGWASSIPTNDYGRGTYKDAIKAIVERGNKWLIVTGGPNVTHNICAVAVDVYEYEEAIKA